MSNSRKMTAAKPAARQPRKASRRLGASKLQKRPATAATRSAPSTGRSRDTSAPRSKKATIIALLQRPDGVPITELTEVTGWQVHSVRAALTGLRKAGKELIRIKDAAGITHYRLSVAA